MQTIKMMHLHLTDKVQPVQMLGSILMPMHAHFNIILFIWMPAKKLPLRLRLLVYGLMKFHKGKRLPDHRQCETAVR